MSMSFLLYNLLTVVVALVAVAVSYVKWTYSYWNRRGVPSFPPKFPYGNLESPKVKTRSMGVQIKDMYAEARRKGWKHCGIYFSTQPIYMVADLEYLKNVMQKDFQYFVDRGMYFNERDDPIGAHLFAIGGARWKNLRAKLTPTFTAGKMKNMFPILIECVELLIKVMETKPKEAVDIKDVSSGFTTDVIGSCAFGLDCKAIQDEDSPFKVYGNKVFTFDRSRVMKTNFSNSFPRLAKFLRIKKVPTEIADFFTKIVKDTVEYREKNNVSRKDFLQLLIDMKDKDDGGDKDGGGEKFTMEEVIAQSFLFFLAGFETSSTTMTFSLYQLARNRDIQEKVRKEINSVLAKYDGKITYESINDMKYMSQVIEETMRLHPPAPFVTRFCVKEYHVPDSDVVIEKGTRVLIPIYGVHMDEEYYPEPEKFDPERFSDENKQSRHQFSYLAFGEGPRICIGNRFGMMQAKVGLTSLLRRYRFTVNKKTQEPLQMTINSITPSAVGGIWLDVENV